MKLHRNLLVLAVLVGVAVPAPAGIFSNLFKRRQEKQQQKQQQQQPTNPYQNNQNPYRPQPSATQQPQPNPYQQPVQAGPGQRISQLVSLVKSAPHESQRAAAAKELREYDAQAYPAILSVLIDVLQSDPDASVRAEAADSLGKLRPVSQQAGWALQQAINKDSSTRVRWQARASLMQYQMSGYNPQQMIQPPPGVPTTAEPPLAEPEPITATPDSGPKASPVSRPTTVPLAPRTTEPPLSAPPAGNDEGPILIMPR